MTERARRRSTGVCPDCALGDHEYCDYGPPEASGTGFPDCPCPCAVDKRAAEKVTHDQGY